MQRPTISEYDRWKRSPVGVWVDEYRQEQADMIAGENGRAVGTFENMDEDYMKCVRMAGFVAGIEDAINHDPFEDEREEQESESESGESSGSTEDGL